MIDLYTWTTPNGRKVSIVARGARPALHVACDRHFQGRAVSAGLPEDQSEQPHPGDRRPRQRDEPDGVGAILIYLADKTGKRCRSRAKRATARSKAMWQMGGPGPMLGQVHHFVKYNKGKAPYAEERYLEGSASPLRRARPAARRTRVRRRHLFDRRIAIWPWISRFEWQTIDMGKYPNVNST